MKLKFTIILLFSCGVLYSQKFSKVYQHEVDRSFMKVMNGITTDFHISNTGDYVVMATEEYVKVLDKQGNEIIKYDCLPKVNTKSSLASDLIGGKMGEMIKNIKLDEGNGFWLFEKDKLVVLLDWNLDNNLLIGYDLSNGDKLWQVDQLRYSPGKDGQLAAVLAATALTAVASETFSTAAIMANSAFREIHSDMTRNEGHGSQRARAYITPLANQGSFLLTNSKGITCIETATGKEKWTYDKRDIKIGDHVLVPKYNDVFLINYSPDFFLNSKSFLVRLDVETGEEIAVNDFKGYFGRNRLYLTEDKYILDYFGAEVYDLATDNKLFETISQEEYAEKEEKKAVISANEGRIAPRRSWFDGNNIYTTRSDAGTRKITTSAWNLNTGKKLWTTEEMDPDNKICALSNGQIVYKQFGIGKNFFSNRSKATGEITAGPVKITQNLLVENRQPWLFFSDQHLIHNGKNELHFLNKETLAEEKAIKTKKAKVGDLLAMDLLPTGLIMIGVDGAAFYDKAGNFENRIKIKEVQSGIWNNDFLVVFTAGNVFKSGDIITIDASDKKLVDEVKQSDLVVFSPALDHCIMVDKKRDTELNLYAVQ